MMMQLEQWGFRQCLPFSWTTLRGKHCRHPIAVMGVVDTFRPRIVILGKHGVATIEQRETRASKTLFNKLISHPNASNLINILKNYIAPLEKIPPHYVPSPEIWCILFSYLKIIKLPPFYFHIRQNYPEQPSLDKAKVRILPSNCLGL